MRLLVVSGELSGSLYAREVIERLRGKVELSGVFHGEVEGAEKLLDPFEITAFGIFEGVRKLPAILRAKGVIEDFLRRKKPEGALLIDFPGFNLKVASICKSLGVKVFYFIPPKLWAWGEWRIKKLKELVDRLFVVFPFEVDFYRERGVEATFVGNPLVDMVKPGEGGTWKRPETEELYCAMPGSRESEVKRLLKPIMEASLIKGGTWVVPVAESLEVDRVKEEVKRLNPKAIPLPQEERYRAMALSRAGVISSGTASLEAALLGLPHVVVYRLNRLTYALAKRLVKTPFVSLPNIIAGRELLPELLQEKVNGREIVKSLEGLLERREEIGRALLEEVRGRLKGNCFENLTQAILEELER
jgi:lipid-A-disaccharide synthase